MKVRILYSPYTSHEGNLLIKTDAMINKITLVDMNESIVLESSGYLCLNFSCEVSESEIDITDKRITLTNVSFVMVEIEDINEEDSLIEQIDLISKGSAYFDINNGELIVSVSEDSEEYVRVSC